MKLKPGNSVRYREELWTFNGYTTHRMAVISAKGRRAKAVGADKIVRAYTGEGEVMPWICQLHGEVKRVRKSGVSLHCSRCKHRVEFRPSPLELLIGMAEVRQAWDEDEHLRRAGMPVGERVETQIVSARIMEMDG